MERWAGPFSTPNVAGLYVAQLTILIFIFYNRLPVIARAFAIVALSACCFGLAATQSRAAALALVVSMFVLLVQKIITVRYFVITLCLTGAFWAILFAGENRFSVGSLQSTAIPRFQLWMGSLELTGQSLVIGWGSESQWLLNGWIMSGLYLDRFNTSLNDTLSIFVRYGMAGAFLYQWSVAFIIMVGINNPKDRVLLALSLTCLCYYLCSMFQSHLWNTEVLAILLFSIVIVLYRMCTAANRFGYTLSPFKRPLVISIMYASAFTLALSLSAIVVSQNDIKLIRTPTNNTIAVGRQTKDRVILNCILLCEPKSTFYQVAKKWREAIGALPVSVTVVESIDHGLQVAAGYPNPSVIVGFGQMADKVWNNARLGRLGTVDLLLDSPRSAPVVPCPETHGGGNLVVLYTGSDTDEIAQSFNEERQLKDNAEQLPANDLIGALRFLLNRQQGTIK